MSFRTFVAAVIFASLASSGAQAEDQVLKVGSTPTGIPFTFLDTKTNTIEGVMVDLIKEVGKEAGFKVEIEGMQFSTLIPSLTAGKIDIISAAMFITAPRKEVIDFSGPVYTYGEGLIVPKADAKDYKEFADLKGETVGAQKGTAFVDPLQKSGLFAEVKIYDNIPAILADVNSGRLKAGFADKPILAYNIKQGMFPGGAAGQLLCLDRDRLARHRRAQERWRVAGQDQRRARQAHQGRHGEEDPGEMGP